MCNLVTHKGAFKQVRITVTYPVHKTDVLIAGCIKQSSSLNYVQINKIAVKSVAELAL